MRIFYLTKNPITEYKEIKILLDLGHEVFSAGEQLEIREDNNRFIMGLHSMEMRTLFWDLHPNYKYGKPLTLHPDFIKKFDLFIFSDELHYVSHSCPNIFRAKKKALWIWRQPARTFPQKRSVINNFRGKGLRTIDQAKKSQHNAPLPKEVLEEFLNNLPIE
jgi:hypothetical protein